MTNREVIFNSLSFGDLILAKRLPDTRMIEYGHRNGPFLVIGRKDDKLMCLYATSKDDKDTLIKIQKNSYNLNKDTYITPSMRLISIDEFINSIYYLNEREKKNIVKFLYINGFKKHSMLKEPKLEVGDIFQSRQKHRYLIISESSKNYVTIRVNCNEDMTYDFNYDSINVFSKEKKYKRIHFLSDDDLDMCLSEFRKVCDEKKARRVKKRKAEDINIPLQVGNLIVYNNLFYYLYFELEGKKLAFSVSKNKNSMAQEISIGGDLYYANFGAKRDFSDNQGNVLFVSTATEEEQQLIKKKRQKQT